MSKKAGQTPQDTSGPKFQTFVNRATKSVRVITLSPLARIFQPFVDLSDYLDDPKKLYARDPAFNVVIAGSWQTYSFKSGVIHSIDESLAYAWVGHDNQRFRQEFDATGLVYFNVPDKIAAALDYVSQTGERLPEHIDAELRRHMDHFRALSHMRVVEHCKRLYNSMMKSRQLYNTHNLKAEDPNDMELLIAMILRDEVRKVKERRRKARAAFDEAASEIDSAATIGAEPRPAEPPMPPVPSGNPLADYLDDKPEVEQIGRAHV